jgi:hypothetical protein
MKSFNLLLWEEMSRANEPEAKEMKRMVMQNTTTGSWQRYCSSTNRVVKCEFTSSPLMDLTVFINIFCNAMKKLASM